MSHEEISSNQDINPHKKFYRIIIAILILALAAFAYIYFFLLPNKGGGGVVVNAPSESGQIKFHFAVYGPGKGKYPRLKKPMSVATDNDGKIYVTDSGHNRVVVFDKSGQFLFEFGKSGKIGDKNKWQPGMFNYPYGIDIDKETGNIFVADMMNKRIQIFDALGQFIDWFPKKPYGGISNDIFPTDIAIEKGKVYICNPYQIVIFDTKGNFVKEFGMPGSQDGQFDRPNGIDIGDDGSIYVSDCNNLRLQAFSSEGKHKWTFGKKVGVNNNSGRELGLPRNIAVGPDGNIYLADAFHFNIKVFTPEGKKIAEMGKRGAGGGAFNYPNGIEVRGDKVIYIVEKENHRVQAIELKGFVIDKSRT